MAWKRQRNYDSSSAIVNIDSPEIVILTLGNFKVWALEQKKLFFLPQNIWSKPITFSLVFLSNFDPIQLCGTKALKRWINFFQAATLSLA